MADPRALAAISLADLEEFATAYEHGELKFVSETKVMEHSGPHQPGAGRVDTTDSGWSAVRQGTVYQDGHAGLLAGGCSPN